MRFSLVALLAAFAPAFSYASVPPPGPPVDDKGIFSLVVENDSFTNSDRGYTSGVRAAWLSPDTHTPDWAEWASRHILPLAPDGAKRVSLAAGQSIFTPGDIHRSDPIFNDRPYAGWLYGSVGVVSDTGKTLDNVMLTLGVVGPWSYAEESQKFLHHVISSPQPQGWNHQLQNEPGAIFTYERKWRSLYQMSPFGIGADVTPSVGANLGNVETDAIVGATFRLGYDLPADYGPPRVRPSLPGSDFFIPTRELGGYLFAGFEGRGVARNIFLDGNTFSNSMHVNKEPFVGSAQLGVAVTYGDARLSFTHVFLTKEFTQQAYAERFGVLTFSYRF